MESFTPQNAAILLVDHQDGTIGWVKSVPVETVIANVRMLGRLGAEMGVPLVVGSTMEQNVGTNIPAIQEVAPDAYARHVARGGTINAFDDEKFREAVKATGRKNLILAGLTTDICVQWTAMGALREGYNVQVVADASGSMSALADQVTFDRLRGEGVIVTDANQVLTELYQDFGTPEGQRAMMINIEEVVSKL